MDASGTTDECLICMEPLEGFKMEMDCGHSNFHCHCAMTWFLQNRGPGSAGRCPCCRQDVVQLRLVGEKYSAPQVLFSKMMQCNSCDKKFSSKVSTNEIVFCERCGQSCHGRCAKKTGDASSVLCQPCSEKALKAAKETTPPEADMSATQVENLLNAILIHKVQTNKAVSCVVAEDNWSNRSRLLNAIGQFTVTLTTLRQLLAKSKPLVHKFVKAGLVDALCGVLVVPYVCKETNIQDSICRKFRIEVWGIFLVLSPCLRKTDATSLTPVSAAINSLRAVLQQKVASTSLTGTGDVEAENRIAEIKLIKSIRRRWRGLITPTSGTSPVATRDGRRPAPITGQTLSKRARMMLESRRRRVSAKLAVERLGAGRHATSRRSFSGSSMPAMRPRRRAEDLLSATTDKIVRMGTLSSAEEAGRSRSRR